MTALPADSFSLRGHALLRTFRAAFEALQEHAKDYPAEHAEISAACAAHVRSAAPMALVGLPPVDPVAAVSRDLADGSHYDMERNGDKTRVYIRDATGHDVACHLNALEVTRMRADFAAVAGGGK